MDQRVAALDAQIAAMFGQHPQAAIIPSMPGSSPILGAGLLVTAGDLAAFPSVGHLAAAAGLVPVPNDSGRRTGEPAQAPPLRPPAPTRALPIGADQHDARRAQPRLLPQETSARLHPQSGCHRARARQSRCPVGVLGVVYCRGIPPSPVDRAHDQLRVGFAARTRQRTGQVCCCCHHVLVVPDGLLGRGRELDEVDAFLQKVPSGLWALTLCGPAGIGKTTVWSEGVRRAEERGYLVLSARPAQAERSLSFAGLADLLSPVGQEALETLAPLQRHALDVALLRAEPGPQPTALVVPAAVLCLLRHLASTGPVLIAVDDAQWLDAPTGESLPFALRRVERLPVGVLVSVRADRERPVTFEAAVPGQRRREVLLGPLSVPALHGVLKQHLQHSLPRATLVRVAASCGGNPFYSLEIARELERVGVPPPGQPLPVPGELQVLVRSRLARLPERTKDALLTAACLSQPTTAAVDLDAVGPAEEAGIIRVDSLGRLRFGHPLLAAAVQESATAAALRAVHRRLAGLITDPEERARHLAASSTGPDEAVAAALDAAAERAAGRAAMTAATDLARRAIELTVDCFSDRAVRRAISFARYGLLGGGDPAEVRAVLESALRVRGTGDLRAELHLGLAFVAREEGRAGEAYQPLLAVLAETTDPMLAARIHLQAIWLAEADPVHGLAHCEAILGLVSEAGEPGLYSEALLLRAYFRLISGLGADDAAVERGRAIEDRAVADGLRYRNPVPVIWPLLKDDLAQAAAVHTAHLDWARQIGEQALEMSMASYLSLIELLRGDWARAARWAQVLADIVEQSGSSRFWINVLMVSALVDAYAGRLDRAEAAGTEALSLTLAHADFREADVRQLLGFVALSRRDLAGAVAHLDAADQLIERLGQREPAQYRFHPDLAEALIGLGELDRAQAHIDRLADRARTFPRPWTLATGARCRGLLLAARGDLDGAATALREALAHHENLQMPFERGRTLLACGQLLRRRNERRQARAYLGEAVSVFDALGATVWAERARHELGRLPARRAAAGLTATEDQVARLAAAGLSNRQIAERAFVSTKTVEANLSRAYLKLGIRSRTQLIHALAERDRSPTGSQQAQPPAPHPRLTAQRRSPQRHHHLLARGSPERAPRAASDLVELAEFLPGVRPGDGQLVVFAEDGEAEVPG